MGEGVYSALEAAETAAIGIPVETRMALPR